MAEHSLRFDDPQLHARFMSELQRTRVPHRLGTLQAVECTEEEWEAVNSVAHTIRSSCFRWYFSWWKSHDMSQLYLEALRQSGLPFQLEHHEGKYVFLQVKGRESEYERLSFEVMEEDERNAT